MQPDLKTCSGMQRMQRNNQVSRITWLKWHSSEKTKLAAQVNTAKKQSS